MDEVKKYLQSKKDELDTAFPPPQAWEKIRQSLHPETRVRSIHSGRTWMAAAAAVLIAAAVLYISQPGTLAVQMVAGNTQLLQSQKDITAKLPKSAPDLHSLIQPSRRPLTATVDTVPVIGYLPKEETAGSTVYSGTVSAKRKRTPAAKQLRKNGRFTDTGLDSSFSIEANYASYVKTQLDQLRRQPVYIDDPGYFDFFKAQFAALEKEEQQVKSSIRREGLTDVTLDALIRTYQQKASILRDLQFEINRVNTRTRTQPGAIRPEPSYINL